MTKHLGAALIQKNLIRMRMAGRAGKAAQLHGLARSMKDDLVTWEQMQRAAGDQRGGDRWRTRGANGVWYRWHKTPRLSLFTPYKVAKGPSKDVSLHHSRFTWGVTASGQRFEFHDDWTTPERAHQTMDECWVGCTVFVERGERHSDFQHSSRAGEQEPAYRPEDFEALKRVRWADVEDA